ncbi:MAG: tripartite tricarboxylate transporter substrate binding protein [Fusobacteriaceae bacterium]
MKNKIIFIFIFSLLCTISLAEYPKKNITLVVPFSAGGGTDAVARKISNIAEQELGKPIIILNKTGGAGAVGMTYGAKSKNDGYTLTMITREIVSLPLMKLAKISSADYELISLINLDSAVVVVNANSKYKTFDALLKDVKDNPGKIKFASTAKPNFYALALEGELGIKFNHIPYNGAGETIPALLGNHADFTLVGPGEVAGQVQGGALKILGVMSEERIDGLEEIPTLKELGYNISSGTWRGIGVPKGTSFEIKNKLEMAFKNALESEEFKSFMKNSNYGIKYLSGEEFKIFIKEDTENIEKVIEMIK